MTNRTAAGHRPSAFREHHARTKPVASKLFQLLIDEWIDLNADPHTQQALGRLARLEPVLADKPRPCDVVDAIDAADDDAKAEMVTALLRLVQAGHQIAGRILLQQMLPLIGKFTRTPKSRARDAESNRWPEDRRHIAVAEFWDLINTIDLDRSTRPIGTLSWALYYRLNTRPYEGQPTVFPVGDPQDLLRYATPISNAEQDSPHAEDHFTLTQVLEWAVDGEIISSLDAQLLTHIYIDGHTALQAAERFQLGYDQTRTHCSRAKRRIAAAVADARDQGEVA